MSEKENQYPQDILLQEAYDLTENRWQYIAFRDLKRAIVYKIEEDYNGRRNWVRRESKDAKRQLEVIHLLLLVRKIDDINLRICTKELQILKPDDTNNIQPLYIPEQTEEEQGVLDIQLNSGYHMIINENSFLYKPPTEI